jgi:hypothetical protein
MGKYFGMAWNFMVFVWRILLEVGFGKINDFTDVFKKTKYLLSIDNVK